MTHRRHRALLLVAVLGTALAPATTHAQDTAGQKSFLWSVHRGENTLYLAGSVHALTPEAYPLSPAFEHAFAEAGTLVEEINLAEVGTAAPMLLSKGMYLDGRRFDTVVSRETAALVAARMKASGLPPQMIQTMKPWMVMLTITALEAQRAGFDPNLGLDKHFFDRATAAGKRVEGLETAASQLDRLDRMPVSAQEQLLLSTLNELDTIEDSLQRIVAAWKRGDSTEIETTLLGAFDGYPAAYASLIVERNRNWMPQIEACFARSRPCLVVVGAAHLVGADGLLSALRARGYRVEQQ
jgi:uncharacterized protein YbaP (TraB family)